MYSISDSGKPETRNLNMGPKSRSTPISASSLASSASPSGKRARDPEDEVYLDNVCSQKRYLSKVCLSLILDRLALLNGLTVGDSGSVNMLDSPSPNNHRNRTSYLYDMDRDDEQCLARIHERSYAENSASYEIIEDMFEKASTKRQIKGMPLIRHLQALYRSLCTWADLQILTISQHLERRRAVMMMEMHVNISGHTKVDVGGNDREESPTIGTASPSSSKVVKKAKIA
ncbi:unnamed protein product [Brassica oleracea]